jgi:hypothetical protein
MAKPPHPGKKTMEVDISWLETTPAVQKTKRNKPPRMPGAAVTVPPLPVAASEPPRRSEKPGRSTIEVELDWVELVDEHGNVVKKPTEKK